VFSSRKLEMATYDSVAFRYIVRIARIYEVFPLLCPPCGGQMRIIAFITHSADIGQILEHIGADCKRLRALKMPGSTVIRISKHVTYLASCG